MGVRSRARSGVALIMTATEIAACSGGDRADSPPSIGSSRAASATGEVIPSASPSASPIPLSKPALPDIQTIGELGGVLEPTAVPSQRRVQGVYVSAVKEQFKQQAIARGISNARVCTQGWGSGP